jgi:two-component system response regulator GlrR
VELPALRDRRGDIEVLSRHFLTQFARQGHGAKSLSPAALRKLMLQDWPGNVRELYNTLQRAMVMAESTILSVDDLPSNQTCAATAGAEGMRESKARANEDFERAYVEQMLRKHVGNITHAAREAGKDRRAFGRLVKKYNLSKLA